MSAQGYLVAFAYTSDAMIPIEDATVTVTLRTASGLTELLAIRLTDESGRTGQLTIPTPDLSASQSPSRERPFTSVDITAEHPLYERILVEEVQIFPDTVTTQNLQMIPLDEAPEAWNQTEIFEVPPQNL